HTRGAYVEVSNMLEKIQVPPDLVQCVVRLTAGASAFRTGELAAPGKIDIDIDLLLLGIKRTTLHQPRWKQAKSHLKEVGVLHGVSLLDTTPYQKMTSHAIHYKMTLPTHNSEEPLFLYFGLGTISACGFNPWIRDFVPEKIMGRFFGKRMAIGTAAGAVLALLAGVGLE